MKAEGTAATLATAAALGEQLAFGANESARCAPKLPMRANSLVEGGLAVAQPSTETRVSGKLIDELPLTEKLPLVEKLPLRTMPSLLTEAASRVVKEAARVKEEVRKELVREIDCPSGVLVLVMVCAVETSELELNEREAAVALCGCESRRARSKERELSVHPVRKELVREVE